MGLQMHSNDKAAEETRARVLSPFGHVWLFVTLWIVALQAPRPWGSPGKNTAVGCHFLLQGIFLTQGSDTGLSCLLHWQVGSLPLVSSGKPEKIAGVLSLGQDAAGNFPG